MVVIGSPYRAYGFAWSITAVLAQHWDEPGLGVREFTFPVAFNADPGLGASFKNAIFLVDGNVVFSLATFGVENLLSLFCPKLLKSYSKLF